MHALSQDIRFALRGFLRAPGITLLAMATLALGIGANAAIFSVVHRVLIAPLPYPHADRIVIPWRQSARLGGISISPSLTDLQKWRALPSVESIVMYSGGSRILSTGDEPRTVYVHQIEPGLLDFTGTRPRLGRVFTPDDAASEAAARVLLLSDRVWRRDFGADAGVVGRRIELSDQPYEIVGVLPPSFRLPMGTTEMLAPLPPPSPPSEGRPQHVIVSGMIRLKPGVTREAATAEISAAGVESLGGKDEGWTARLEPATNTTGAAFRRAVLVLTGAVAFVLLIACANVANIVLARNAAREREIAVRVALGAGRARLVQQLLTENLLIAAIGGSLGLLLAVWGLQAVSALRPAEMTELRDVTISRPVLLFAFALTLATGLLFGLAPALAGTRVQLADGLRHGTRTMGGARGQFARRALSVVEVALALILLAGAGLLLKSYARLQAADLGFRPAGVLAAQVRLPESRYATDAARHEFYTRFAEQARALAGVREVAIAVGTPPRGGVIVGRLEVKDTTVPPDPRPGPLGGGWVSAGFFEVLAIPMREGRTFAADDADRPVAIVGESLARQYWPGTSPIGKELRFGQDSPWHTIVGVAGDVKSGATDRTRLQVYVPISKGSVFPEMTLLVSAASDPAALIPAIKAQAWSLDPKLPMSDVKTVEARIADLLARPRFNLTLLSAFALLGLLLATIGIYGVISYGVGMRRQEIGVRMALGALPRDIRRTVMGEALLLAGVGAAIGLAGALALSRVLASMLFDVSATDPATLAAVASMLCVAAVAAAWLPARRAMRVDPMVALRAE